MIGQPAVSSIRSTKVHLAITVAGASCAASACGLSVTERWYIGPDDWKVSCPRCIEIASKYGGVQTHTSVKHENSTMDEPDLETKRAGGANGEITEEVVCMIERLLEATDIMHAGLLEDADNDAAEGQVDSDLLDEISYYEEAINKVNDFLASIQGTY